MSSFGTKLEAASYNQTVGSAAPTERQATALDEIAMRLDQLIASFGDIGHRMRLAASRSLGPEPEPPGAKPTSAEPNSTISLLIQKLDALNTVVDFQRIQMARIERVL